MFPRVPAVLKTPIIAVRFSSANPPTNQHNEPKTRIGWWVGWIEWPEGPVYFATNITMPNGAQDLPKRQSVTRAVLRSINALAPN